MTNYILTTVKCKTVHTHTPPPPTFGYKKRKKEKCEIHLLKKKYVTKSTVLQRIGKRSEAAIKAMSAKTVNSMTSSL